jgi:hypothetical protein
VEAASLSEDVNRYSFSCREALDKALNAWNIVVFDDFGHGMGCMVVSVNNTDYT